MSYKLVIAEKPSVAQSIAKVISADMREDGYLEGSGYIVGFARTGVVTETVERKGIGTSATRAATIEKLVRMNEIEGMITELVRTYKIIEDAEVLMHPVLEEIGICPCCGSHVVERQKGYSCENRQCNFVLWKQNRFFEALGKKMTKPVAVKLLSDGKVALKGCKSKKTGKTYDTTVIMTVDENQRAVFELNFEKGVGEYGKSKNKKD